MLFTRFIFVRRWLSCSSFPSFSLSLFLSFSRITSVLLATFILSLTSHLSFFILTHYLLFPLAPPPPISFTLFLHFRYSFSLAYSSLFLHVATLSLAYSKSRSLSFFSFSLLLATSLILFSVLLASLSSLCLPFRLLVYTLMMRSPSFSFSLGIVRCFPIFLARVLTSLFPRVHHCGGTLGFIVSVSPSLSHSRFRLVPPAYLSTHVERYFSPFSSCTRPSFSLFRTDRRFIPSAQGRLKTSQTLSASKRERSE